MTAIRFVDQPDGWTRVSFPYDVGAVAIVKGLSPGRRAYDGSTKSWRVLTEVAETLADAFAAAGYEIVADGDQVVEARPVPTLDQFFTIDSTNDGFDPKAKAAEIIASLPGQHVGKVFRAMAKQLYPDLYRRK